MERAVKRLVIGTIGVLVILLVIIGLVAFYTFRAAGLPIDAQVPIEVIQSCVENQVYMAESPEGPVELTIISKQVLTGRDYCLFEAEQGGML